MGRVYLRTLSDCVDKGVILAVKCGSCERVTAAKPTSTAAQVTAAAESQGGSPASAAKDDTAVAVRELRDENVAMRRDLTMALATIASNTGKSARVLDMAQQVSGGPELAVAVYTGG